MESRTSSIWNGGMDSPPPLTDTCIDIGSDKLELSLTQPTQQIQQLISLKRNLSTYHLKNVFLTKDSHTKSYNNTLMGLPISSDQESLKKLKPQYLGIILVFLKKDKE
jgi:hypothetical protein